MIKANVFPLLGRELEKLYKGIAEPIALDRLRFYPCQLGNLKQVHCALVQVQVLGFARMCVCF